MYTILSLLKKEAKKKGIKLNRLTHVHFVYGFFVINWANRLAKWLFPGIGAIPVTNRGTDLKGLKAIREILVYGQFPLALAPEEQVTYHNDSCGEISGGIISMASWCKDDLEKLNIDKKVNILPVTFYYDYGSNKDKELIRLKKRPIRELNSNYIITSNHTDDLLRLTTDVLDRIEKYYLRYHYFKKMDYESIDHKIESLIDRILNRAEIYFNIDPNGSILDRVLTIRAKGATYLVSDDFTINRNLADHMATEAYSILRHMELADILEYIDTAYITEVNNKNRYIEYILNLIDVLNRLDGGTIKNRYSTIKKSMKVVTGKPIEYKKTTSRVEKREQIKTLKNKLQKVRYIYSP